MARGQPTQLLNAWERRDREAFKQALEEGCDPNHVYEGEINQPILSMIAREKDSGVKDYVNLLSKWVDINKQCLSGKCAIHLAAAAGNLCVLEALVEANADINAQEQLGSTVLHELVEQKWDKNFQNCLKFILGQKDFEKERNLNHSNQSGYTPIHWAAKYKNRDAIMALLEKGFSLLDLDNATVGFPRRTARDDIIKFDASLKKDLPPKLESIKMDGSRLFNLLYYNEQDKFSEVFRRETLDESQKKKLATCNNGKQTILQYACANNMTKVVRALLEHGADVNLAFYDTLPPIYLVFREGNRELLKVLLNNTNVNQYPNIGDYTPLHFVLKHCNNFANYTECLQIFLDKYKNDGLDINAQDFLGNTALHYAVLYADDRAVIEFIRSGAYIGVLNKNRETPLHKMRKEAFKNCLDELIEIKIYERLFFRMKLNYAFLNQSQQHMKCQHDRQSSVKVTSKEKEQLITETEPLLRLSEEKHLRELLEHPVLAPFIYFKWQRIQRFYYINLVFYLLFTCLLTGYILFGYETNTSNNATLHSDFNRTEFHDQKTTVGIDKVKIVIFLFLIGLSFREVFQFYFKPKSYFRDIMNYAELALIILTVMLLSLDCGGTTESSICSQVCSYTVLFSWTISISLLGKHPKFAVQFEMFRKVTSSFYKYFGFYILLIIAFALSFFVLFRECSECQNNNTFTNPLTSIFRSIIMLSGELDSGDIPFMTYIGTSHIMFIMFVLLITIILLNLLNGLAVADTKQIYDEASIYALIGRIRFIVFTEKVFSSKIMEYIMLKTKISSRLSFFDHLSCVNCKSSKVGPPIIHVSADHTKNVAKLYRDQCLIGYFDIKIVYNLLQFFDERNFQVEQQNQGDQVHILLKKISDNLVLLVKNINVSNVTETADIADIAVDGKNVET